MTTACDITADATCGEEAETVEGVLGHPSSLAFGLYKAAGATLDDCM